MTVTIHDFYGAPKYGTVQLPSSHGDLIPRCATLDNLADISITSQAYSYMESFIDPNDHTLVDLQFNQRSICDNNIKFDQEPVELQYVFSSDYTETVNFAVTMDNTCECYRNDGVTA